MTSTVTFNKLVLENILQLFLIFYTDILYIQFLKQINVSIQYLVII